MSNTPSTYSSFPNGLVSRNVPILDSYPGNIFWVDSVNGSNGNKGTFKRPFASIAYVYDNAAGLNFTSGDKLYCKNGHIEAVIAAATLDLDVAGTAIVFLGEGSDRAQINFTTVVSADMDIDAANITLVNPLFVAGIDALTGPIDVNAADFTIIGGEYRDAASIDTTDAIVADGNADRMVIDGYRYVRGDEGGTQKQSHIQVAGAQDCKLNNIDITGDFGTGIIENGTAWVDANLTNLVINNKSSSPTVGVLLQSGSTGWMVDSSIRVASGEVFVTAGSNMQFDNAQGTGIDGGSASEIGIVGGGSGPSTPTGGLSFSGTNTAASTTTPVVAELAGFGDDFFNEEYFMYVVKDAAGSGGNPEGEYRFITDYVSDTGTFTVNAFGTALASGDEIFVLHKSVVNDQNNVSYVGINTSASVNTLVINKLAGFGDDYFNNQWYLTVIKDGAGGSIPPEGNTRLITDYTSLTGGFVTVNFGTALADGDVCLVSQQNHIETHVQGEKATSGSTAVMANGDTIFTVTNGPIEILDLVSQCITSNDATATTLTYRCNPTLGNPANFSGASASLASVTAGEAVILNGTALSTAPDVSAGALIALTGVHTRGVIIDAGTVELVVGVGTTTGTWKHFLRWRPLEPGTTVVGT